jgi:hypothetical protein
LRKAVRVIELGMISDIVFRRHLRTTPFHLHEAASAYFLMRQRLLALYETSHMGLHPRLAAAL